MSAWKQLLLCVLLATATLALEGRDPRPTAWPHAVPLRQHQTRNTPIISHSKAPLAHQAAASYTTSWATGDFVAAGHVPFGTKGAVRSTVRVYDGRTLQLKADWSPLVEQVCGTDFSNYMAISSPGLSPDNQRSMGLSCNDGVPGDTLAIINITDINAPTVQSSTLLSISIESMQYNREGNLVVLAAYPSMVLLFNTTSNTVTSQAPYTDPGFAYRQDLTTDGINLLMPDNSPEVLSFNLSTGALNPINFASIPDGICTSVLAQYDGSALVGCYSVPEGWCAYHVAGPGLNSSTNTSTILNKWCTAVENTFAAMVMDMDRESFVINIYNSLAFYGDDVSMPNTFRLRLSDFALVGNWSVPTWWFTVTAYGALPANQQNCPVGFKQCCSPAGAVRPKGAVCSSSPEPCLLDATCDGTSITCPTQQKAADGTTCSLAPAGLFKAASGPLGRMAAGAGAAADIGDAEAMKNGYKKCHRCFDGQCLKKGKVTRQEGRLAELTPAEPWFYCR